MIKGLFAIRNYKKLRVGYAFALLLLLPTVNPLRASDVQRLADLDLDDLVKVRVESVFGASKYLQEVTDAPAAVSVITRRDIEAYGYRTLGEILNSTHGVNVTYDRNYSYVGVRGFQRPGDYNTRILVLVDGHRANDNIYDMAQVGTDFPMDVELIERVEIIRGPTSSLYGTNAFFAVVNVVTAKGSDLDGVRVGGQAGTLHTGKGAIAFGKTFANGLDLKLSSSLYRSRGQSRLYTKEFASPETNSGVAENLDDDAYARFFAALEFKGFTLQGLYGARDKRVPTAAYDTAFNNPAFKTIDGRGWLDLRYVRQLGKGLTVTSRVYYDQYDYNGRYPYALDEADATSGSRVYADYARGKWWGAEVDAEKSFSRHRITSGMEYRDNFKMDQGGFEVEPYQRDFEESRNSNVVAAFLEDQFTIHRKLLLNAGLRHDRYDDFGGTTNPRVGLIFRPAKKSAIKALWGSAFRAPNAYESFYTSNQITANRTLKPETIRTGEIVLEHYFADHYRIMASAYSSRIRDLINQVATEDGTLSFVNLDSATTRGMEVEFEGKWWSGIAARASYSIQHATDGRTHEDLQNSARHLATANIALPLGRRYQAALDVRYVGRVQTLNGATTSPFVVPNLTVSTRESRRGFSVSASVYNLFNNRYGYPGFEEHRQNIIYQDGRTFRAGLNYTWRNDD